MHHTTYHLPSPELASDKDPITMGRTYQALVGVHDLPGTLKIVSLSCSDMSLTVPKHSDWTALKTPNLKRPVATLGDRAIRGCSYAYFYRYRLRERKAYSDEGE
jgi:hypothetical protein